MHTPTVLTIAGFDPYGGAGIQIDTKTIHALGGYALSATTAITAQNSQGVVGTEPVSSEMLRLQLATLLDDVNVDAVKIGMLSNTGLIEVVVDMIKQYQLTNIVLDPVLVSSSGMRLLTMDAIEVMVSHLFPLCCLVTPNLMETNTLLGTEYKGALKENLLITHGLFELGEECVLLKGGHTLEKEAVDCLVEPSGMACFSTPRVETSHTHGTGCLLSSAIATHLSKGLSLKESVHYAKDFLYDKLCCSGGLKLQYQEVNISRSEPLF